MKTMNCGRVVCDVVVEKSYAFVTEVPCEYEQDTVAYAVELFISRCDSFRSCAIESWRLRLEKGKGRRPHPFTWIVPAVLMELPGEWVRLTGKVDEFGVKVRKVELLREHPAFSEAKASKDPVKASAEKGSRRQDSLTRRDADALEHWKDRFAVSHAQKIPFAS